MKRSGDEAWNNALFQEDLTALYEKSYHKVVSLIYWKTGDKDDAETAVQTVFLRLIANPKLPGSFRKNPVGYIYRAAVNQMLNVVEARKRQGLDDNDISTLELAEPALDSGRAKDSALVRAILAKMRPERAQLLNLHYLEDLDCIEIGKLQGRSPAAVFVHLSRARAQFKKLFLKEKNDEAQKLRNQRFDRPGFSEAS